MPNHRFTFVPHPITGTSEELCRKYLEGNDPVTGKPVLQEIIDALTAPLSDEDKRTGSIERPSQRLVKPDTMDNLHRLFLENGWTDGLPIVLPTEARVAEMLKGTSSFIRSRCLPTMLTPRNSAIQVFIEVGLSVAGMWHS